MTKYKEYFKKMLEANRELFDEFKKIHDEYEKDQGALQEKFNREGEKVSAVIREWENKLCMQSEKAGYGSYTSTLSEKFQGEVKKAFPLIDHVGIVQKAFTLKKISLS